MAKTQTFVFTGSALWKWISSGSLLLNLEPSASFRSIENTHLSLGLSHWRNL